MDHKAISIVSYPVYYHHSYPTARISESMTFLGFSLESVVLASFPTLRVQRRVLFFDFFVVFVPVTFKFFPFFVCLGIGNVGRFGLFIVQFTSQRNENSGSCDETLHI